MNKRILFTVAIFVITMMTARTQSFNGGFLAGIGAAEISGDRLEGPNKPGIYAGAFVNRYFTERSSAQMELSFVQKGSRKNPDSLDYSTYLLRLNYVELFVNYKWDFGKMFTLEVGPSLGVLIKSYEEADGFILTEPPFNATDLNGNFGLFIWLTERWQFNVRYSNSILAVRPHSQGQTYRWNRGQYNEVLSFTFHYTFL
ncbi:MAG: outer membrane beta-barrel protein [Bacteroidales bacterium]|nr:PorT family protein [Bacteroidales bacterium]NCU36604.1 PorT family protein [Candidatus Falkowbacteria bacterium]MDD2632738.1 outer membrane beta-barrel protein [Bacteroidales bacterium]MDD3525517.1 outer membrane beta-barrel protein [Bacteroidales bacterium]MDD4741586.1 outer membrane beta-barrel protein [Bacteroidales bacterium]